MTKVEKPVVLLGQALSMFPRSWRAPFVYTIPSHVPPGPDTRHCVSSPRVRSQTLPTTRIAHASLLCSGCFSHESRQASVFLFSQRSETSIPCVDSGFQIEPGFSFCSCCFVLFIYANFLI